MFIENAIENSILLSLYKDTLFLKKKYQRNKIIIIIIAQISIAGTIKVIRNKKHSYNIE